MKKGDVNGIKFVLGIALGLMLLLITMEIFSGQIQKAEEATKGCTYLASVIADATGGSLTLC